MEVTKVQFIPREDSGWIENLKVISSVEELNAGELYYPPDNGTCSKCYPITTYCRGHSGVIKLRSYHVNFIYRKRWSKLNQLLCDNCLLPIKTLPKSASEKTEAMYIRLQKCYLTSLAVYECNCTGSSDKLSASEEVGKLHRIYNLPNIDDIVRISNLSTLNNVLKNYVIVVPGKVLEQLPFGTKIMSIYRELLDEKSKIHDDLDLEIRKVSDLYNAVCNALKDKPGIIRQIMIPRRISNSARAVIVSDPNVGICEMGIPSRAAHSLAKEYLVTSLNFEESLVYLENGLVSQIIYDNTKHKVVSTDYRILLVYSQGIIYLESGDLMLTDKKENIYLPQHFKSKEVMLLRKRLVTQITRGDTTVELDKHYQTCILVKVLPHSNGDYNVEIPLQLGCKVLCPVNKQKLLVHRNPVLSADSMHVHYAVLYNNYNNSVLSIEEKRIQKIKCSPYYEQKKHVRLLDSAKQLSDIPKQFLPTVTTMLLTDRQGLGSQVVSYKEQPFTTHRTVSTREPDNFCVITMNPGATEPYGADFDGDEINITSIDGFNGDESGMLLLADLLKGDVGPKHDGMYGLYCIINDKLEYKLLEEICLRFCKSVSKFIMHIKLYAKEQSLKTMSRKCYNQLFYEYVTDKSNVEMFKQDYDGADIHIVDSLYKHCLNVLYKVCDYCGTIFSRRESAEMLQMVNSGARPSGTTYKSIFYNVGNIEYVLPNDKIKYVSIKGNYNNGVSQEEYLHMCYANRADAVSKAINTAPEGDRMRLLANYMSGVKNRDKVWFDGDIPCYEKIDQDSIISIQRSAIVKLKRQYYYSIDDSFPRLQYQENLDNSIRVDNIIHYGQRKLLMSEIDFLTDYSRPGDVVIYGGAAPGTHIYILSKLFEDLTFHLYDDREFSTALYDIHGNVRENIFLHREYITPDNCKTLSLNYDNVLFISDIRTREHNSAHPTEKDVTVNNDLVKNIVIAMQPRAAMLKFRLPYTEGITELLEGEIRLQCWSRVMSTEARLICSRPYKIKNYNHKVHEEIMHYHNIVRPYPILDCELLEPLKSELNKLNIREHYDMYRETHIITKYCTKFTKSSDATYYFINKNLYYSFSYVIKNSTH